MKLTRKNQLPILVSLAALTAALQYALQGVMATGHDPSTLPINFFVIEWVLWTFRALIEAWIVVYLFMTKTQNKQQSVIIAVFEVALISLLAFTLMPIVYTMSQSSPIASILSTGWLWTWSFLISSFTSVMIGAMGYAYKVQSDDGDSWEDKYIQLEAEFVEVEENKKFLSDQIKQLSGTLENERLSFAKQLSDIGPLSGLDATNKLRVLEIVAQIQGHKNGILHYATQENWAKRFGVTTQTVYNARNSFIEQWPKLLAANNGNGNSE